MKNLLALILIAFFVFPSMTSGQTKPNYVGEWYRRAAQGKSPQQANVFTKGSSDFARTKRYNLNANANQLNSILNTQPALLNLVVPYGDKTYVLNLSRVQIASGDFGIRTNNGRASRAKSVQYRGIVDNNPAHIASLSISADDLMGFFSTPEGNFTITKEGLQFIVYNQNDQPVPAGISCATPDITYQVTAPTAPISGIACKTVNVYFECDYAFYQNKGSNITTLTNYVFAFFNQVATLYANENIAIQISEMFVWTSPDPYASLTTTSDVLNQFRTTRGSNFNGNLAHFLTTRNLGGGVAYVNALCNKPYAFGVSMVYSTYANSPAYSWTVEVVTHELGHNLGSPHTHSCSWSTGPLDNCYAVEGTCSPGPAPTNGGTIMSYCHLTSVGINFNNGFGFYPGNLIRDKVQNATCITGGTSSAAPTSLTTSNLTQTSATLNWAATSGALNYTVQYKPASSTTWTSAGTTTSTTMNITGLTGATAYNWTVRSDCSAFASNANFTTTGTAACSAPASLTTTNITQTGATLNWAAVSGATNYTVQYKLAAATTWTTGATVTTTSATLSGLTAASNYQWAVKASCSGFSTSANFTTTSVVTGCNAPTSLTTTNITQTGATLNWAAVSGATNYTVQYKLAAATTWTTGATVTSTSTSLSGLTAASNYQWAVKASCSGFSGTASFTTSTVTTGCTAPASLSSTNVTASTSTLNWGAVSGATSYTVQYKTAAATTWTSVNTTATSFVLSGLTAATTYNWMVKASCSSNSGTANFTTLTVTAPATCAQANSLSETKSGSSVILSWRAPTGGQSYTVQFREVGGTWTTYNTTSTSITIKTRPNRSFEWTVDAKCSNGASSGATSVRRF